MAFIGEFSFQLPRVDQIASLFNFLKYSVESNKIIPNYALLSLRSNGSYDIFDEILQENANLFQSKFEF